VARPEVPRIRRIATAGDDRGDPDPSTALRSLLGGRRLRAGADAERGFRVDGLLEIEVKIDGTAAQDPGPGRLVREVPGRRYILYDVQSRRVSRLRRRLRTRCSVAENLSVLL
jgi:hypothetical protein